MNQKVEFVVKPRMQESILLTLVFVLSIVLAFVTKQGLIVVVSSFVLTSAISSYYLKQLAMSFVLVVLASIGLYLMVLESGITLYSTTISLGFAFFFTIVSIFAYFAK